MFLLFCWGDKSARWWLSRPGIGGRSIAHLTTVSNINSMISASLGFSHLWTVGELIQADLNSGKQNWALFWTLFHQGLKLLGILLQTSKLAYSMQSGISTSLLSFRYHQFDAMTAFGFAPLMTVCARLWFTNPPEIWISIGFLVSKNAVSEIIRNPGAFPFVICAQHTWFMYAGGHLSYEPECSARKFPQWCYYGLGTLKHCGV